MKFPQFGGDFVSIFSVANRCKLLINSSLLIFTAFLADSNKKVASSESLNEHNFVLEPSSPLLEAFRTPSEQRKNSRNWPYRLINSQFAPKTGMDRTGGDSYHLTTFSHR